MKAQCRRLCVAEGRGVIEEIANMAPRLCRPAATRRRKARLFSNPDLARTLTVIAEGGRDAFYRGELARRMDGYFKRIGAPHWATSDFAAHKSEWVDPVSTNYRGYDVWELPPNGQGVAALQILNILEGYDLKAMGRRLRRFLACLCRGQETRLCRPRAFLCRSGVRQTRWRNCCRKTRGETARRHHHGQGRANRYARLAHRRRRRRTPSI